MARVDPTTVAFIADREGFTPRAYADGNHYSIGYGTYATPQEIASGAPISQTDAQTRLATEADKAAAYVDSLNPNLAPNQRTALISAAYNLGSFGSGLTAAIQSGDAPSIASHLAQYTQAENPADAAGVANRRAAEVAYFNGSGTAASPQASAVPPIPQLRPTPEVLNDTLRLPGATPSPNLRPGDLPLPQSMAPPVLPFLPASAPPPTAAAPWLSTLTPAQQDVLKGIVQSEGTKAWSVPGAVTGANALLQGASAGAPAAPSAPSTEATSWLPASLQGGGAPVSALSGVPFSVSAQGTPQPTPSTLPSIGAFGSSGLTPSTLGAAAGTPFNATATGAYAGSFVPDFTAPTAQTNATALGTLPDGTQPTLSGFGSLQPPSTTPTAVAPAPATSWLPQSLQGGAFVPQGPQAPPPWQGPVPQSEWWNLLPPAPQGPQQPAPAWQGPIPPTTPQGPVQAPAPWQGPVPSTPFQGPTTAGPTPPWQGPVTGGPAPAPALPALPTLPVSFPPESVLTSGGASPLHTVTENSVVPPGPFAIDALVRAAMSGDARALASATATTTFQAALAGSANATTQITAYLTALEQSSPGSIRAIQSALQANPTLANSLGGPLGDALKPMLPAAFAALPPGQVPLPNLAPGAGPSIGTLVPNTSAPGFSGFPSSGASSGSNPLSNAAGSTPQSSYLWGQSDSSDAPAPTGWTGGSLASTAQPVQQVSGYSGQVNPGVSSGYNAPAAPAYTVPQSPAASVSGFSAPQQYYTPQAPAVPASNFGSSTNYLLGASGAATSNPLGWSATGAPSLYAAAGATPTGWSTGAAAPKAAPTAAPVQNRTVVQAPQPRQTTQNTQASVPKATTVANPAASTDTSSFPSVPSGSTLLGDYSAGTGGASYDTTQYQGSSGDVYNSYTDENGDTHTSDLSDSGPGYEAPDYSVDQYSAW